MILVTPELNVPLPHVLSPEEAKSLHEKACAAFRTVEFLEENGAPVYPPTEEDKKAVRSMFFDSPGAPKEVNTTGRALMLRSLLNEYDIEVVRNAAQLRGYIKLKLLELSEVGKESTQLRALELLGKLSEVQAFSEHVEINVTHRSTEDLKQALANKLSTYLKDVVDVEGKFVEDEKLIENAPSVQVIDVDDELGLAGNEVFLDSEAEKLDD